MLNYLFGLVRVWSFSVKTVVMKRWITCLYYCTRSSLKNPPPNFVRNLVVSSSQPPDSSALSHDTYKLRRVKAITCHYVAASFWTVACATPGGSVTHSEDSTIHLLPYACTHTVIDRGQSMLPSIPPREHRPVLLYWAPDHKSQWHHRDLNSQSPDDRRNNFLSCPLEAPFYDSYILTSYTLICTLTRTKNVPHSVIFI